MDLVSPTEHRGWWRLKLAVAAHNSRLPSLLHALEGRAVRSADGIVDVGLDHAVVSKVGVPGCQLAREACRG